MLTPNRRFYLSLVGLAVLFTVLIVGPIERAAYAWCYAYYDLGIYSEAVAKMGWNQLNPWLSGRQVHIFNDHFDPVLGLAGAITRWVNPVTALLIFDLASPIVAATALVWLHRRHVLSTGATVLLTALLLFNAGVLEALHFPAHPTTWAMAPMVWLGALLLQRRMFGALVALLCLFACKEEFPFVGLVLAAVLATRRSSRWAAATALALSLAWCVLAFGLRPTWAPTENYAGNLVAGLLEDPGRYLGRRLTTPGMASRLGSLGATLLPIVIWLVKRHHPAQPSGRSSEASWCAHPGLGLLALLMPMLAVRFLGMAWRHHYLAVVMGGAIVALVPWIGQRRIPVWVGWATAAVLLSTNTNRIKFAAQSWTQPATHFTSHCPREAGRLASIAAAVDWLQDRPGKVLVQQNLALPLVQREAIYVPAGAQGTGVEPYDWVLMERPPFGNCWPMGRETLDRWLTHWRGQANTRVVVDDGHVLLLHGQFSVPPAETATPPSADHRDPEVNRAL